MSDTSKRGGDEDAPLIQGQIQGSPGTPMLDAGNAGATIVEDFRAQHAGAAKRLGAGLSDGEGVRFSTGTIGIGAGQVAGETLSAYGPAARGSQYTRPVAAVLGEPAQAGLKKGDVIDAVSGKPARLLSHADANALFKQPPGTAVTLDVAAPGQQPNTVRLLLRDLL